MNLLADQINWMVEQAAADELALTHEDVNFILLTGGENISGYTDGEIEYVLELSDEWYSANPE